jgi:hypothetical protein
MEHISAIAKQSALPNLWRPETSDEVELAFLARQLVQITLPHSDPGDVPVWTRRNGDLTLIMTRADTDDKGTLIGYPYGSLPRLLLYWINSEAVRTKSRRLELGSNLSRFMTELGLNPRNGRGERSDARRLQHQMSRLFGASIRFKQTAETASGDVRQKMRMRGSSHIQPKTSAKGPIRSLSSRSGSLGVPSTRRNPFQEGYALPNVLS